MSRVLMKRIIKRPYSGNDLVVQPVKDSQIIETKTTDEIVVKEPLSGKKKQKNIR